MYAVFLVIHLILCFGLIGLVLIQHGKGADIGASFGSGASNTVFGAQGSGSFLTRLTSILATLFFLNCLFLGFLTAHQTKPDLLKNIDKYSTPVTNISDVTKSKDTDRSLPRK